MELNPNLDETVNSASLETTELVRSENQETSVEIVKINSADSVSETNITTVAQSDDDAITFEKEPVKTDFSSINFTEAQLDRWLELSEYYPEESAEEILMHIKRNGPNTFRLVKAKINVIANPKAYHEYYEELSRNVKLNEVLTLKTIYSIVSKVRKTLGMNRITENVRKKSVDDLFQYFMVEAVNLNKVYLNSTKQVLDGYKAILNLNCQL